MRRRRKPYPTINLRRQNIAAIFVLLIATNLVWASAVTYTNRVPVCAEEDGNPDGMPCDWTDKDTGRVYRVTSEEYRDDQPLMCETDAGRADKRPCVYRDLETGISYYVEWQE